MAVPNLEKEMRKAIVQSRKRLLLVLLPFCLFVAGYSITAAVSSGGWYLNDDTGLSFTPVQHSYGFYSGLRWSVTIVGAIMALICHCWKFHKLCVVFAIIVVIFNPIIVIDMLKGTWEFANVLAFWMFLTAPANLWPDRWM